MKKLLLIILFLIGFSSLQAQIITTIAGNGTAGFSGDGGPATAAELRTQSMAIDSSGNIYVADVFNQRVRKVTPTGIITTIAGNGMAGFSGDGGPATAATMYNPSCIRLDRSGNIYIAEYLNQRIRKINTSGIISTVAGNGTSGHNGDGGPATAAELDYPNGVAVDFWGNVYGIEGGRVRKIDTSGIINTIVDASVNAWEAAVDDSGNIYISCSDGRIKKVNSSGLIRTIAGNGVGGYSGDGGDATNAEFSGNNCIALDDNGNILVADLGNNVIRKINSLGIISTIVGNGTRGYNGNEIVATVAQLNSPWDVQVDNFGNIYVAEQGNERIRKVTPPIAPPITGTFSLCSGAITSLSGTTSGGVWSSSDTTIATIGASTGIVTGVAMGVVTIAYSIGGVSATVSITVNPILNAGTITGDSTVCVGASIILIDTVSGGSWSSNNSGIATISSTGNVNGVNAGTVALIYTTSNGCGTANFAVTVNPLPDAGIIYGPYEFCYSFGAYFETGYTGGTWSSVLGNVVLDTNGFVTWANPGHTDTIIYTVSNICGTTTSTASVTVDTNPNAGSISGPTVLCYNGYYGYDGYYGYGGYGTYTSSGDAGGYWGSSIYGVSIDPWGGGASSSGGYNTGEIFYQVTNACGTASASMEVISTYIPNVGDISGPSEICYAGGATFSSSGDGGIWSSLYGNVSFSGYGWGWYVYVGYANPGTSDLITLTETNACGTSSTSFYVGIDGYPNPGTISGPSEFCYTDGSVSFSSYGSVSWSSLGYYLGTWGSALGNVTLTPSYYGYYDYDNVSSANPFTTDNITYTISNSCGTATATFPVIINGNPAAGIISGTNTLAVGGTATLSETVGGGSWSSDNSSVVSVDIVGNIAGISVGTANISYGVTNSCGTNYATQSVAVSLGFNYGINQAVSFCENSIGDSINSILSLTDTSTSNVDTLSVTSGPLHGTLSGFPFVFSSTGGSVTPSGLSYTPNTGYTGIDTFVIAWQNDTVVATTTVFVTIDPLSIAETTSGASMVCVSANTLLSESVSGGNWSSSNTGIANVDTWGNVTGVSVGTDTIVYSLTNSCGTETAMALITVNPLPVAGSISGANTFCQGSTITISDTSGGGVWSSSNSVTSVIGGVVIGVGSGTSTISYSVTNGCGTAVATHDVTVITTYLNAGTISSSAGPNVCAGSSSMLTSSGDPGGVWSSSDNSIATINSTSGNLYGYSSGYVTITYTLSNGCGTDYTTADIYVAPLPVVSGISSSVSALCVGTSTTLSDVTPGGVWSSSNPGLATVSSSGVVNCISAGSPGYGVINYTVTNSYGCVTTPQVTIYVDSIPHAGTITGTNNTCVGSYINLGNSGETTFGSVSSTWSSSNTSVATVLGWSSYFFGSHYDDNYPSVYGITTGTTNITYTVTNSCGTALTSETITVNMAIPIPAISGASGVCEGATITLSDSTWGGVWTSAWYESGIAVSSSTGEVTAYPGYSGHISTVFYTVNNSCGYTTVSKPITVLGLPNAGTIYGSNAVCIGYYNNLSETVSGGSWSSSNTAIANIDNVSGIVTGVSTGSATISYIVTNVCGSAITTFDISVTGAGTLLHPVIGSDNLCIGSTTSLSEVTTGGVWGSSSTAIATVDSFGVVTGIGSGNVVISYSLTGSCGATTQTKAISVAPTAGSGTISGASTVCAGGTTTLSSSVTGGYWQSSNPGIVYLNSSGLASGIAAGTVAISYVTSTACNTAYTLFNMTVNPLPVVSTITGSGIVCVSATDTLRDGVSGGSWLSGNTGVATISPAGVVTGVAGGYVNITYTVTDICGTISTTKTITINTAPYSGTVSGETVFCVSDSVTISASVSGSWTSLYSNIATVNGSGRVIGVSTGIDSIIFMGTNSCGTSRSVYVIQVNGVRVVPPISGLNNVCIGSAIALSNSAPGGIWSSSNSSVASVSSGIVNGISAGTATITYSLSNSCGTSYTSQSISVNPAPNAGSISGSSSVCVGATITLSETVSGGIWNVSNGNVSISDAGSTPLSVTGVSGGITTVNYVVSNVCGTATASKNITINSLPNAGSILGATSVCVGSTISLSETAIGGTWSCSNNNASISTGSATSSTATGVNEGIDTISYSVSNDCGTASTTKIITVNPLPNAGTVSGAGNVCVGATITLSDDIPGGTWSSSNTNIAGINSTGTVTGLVAGNANITYTVTNSCGSAKEIKNISVNPVPSAGTISVAASVCVGSGISLTATVSGGTWGSSVTTRASVNSSGLVTGIAAGVANIIYTVTNGYCTNTTTRAITVSPLPVAGTISGATSVCSGLSSITLTGSLTGGIWSSSNTSIASVSTAGVVSGVMAGAVTLSYGITNSCGTAFATKSITVLPVPNAGTISGSSIVCDGASTSLTASVTGGSWNSSSPSVATVNSAGLVTGIGGGTVNISYNVSNVCGSAYAIQAITAVNPGTISGPTSVCLGATLSLNNVVTGGSWISSNTTVSTVDISGNVSGISGGSSIITYMMIGTGCFANHVISVNALPAIAGTSTVCSGGSLTTLTNASTGGYWTSSNTAIGTILTSGSGVVYGVAPGTVSISYNKLGCSVTQVVTVSTNTLTMSTGPTAVCVGNNITLANITTGGNWSSNNTSLANVGSGTGVVTGIAVGVPVITYTLGSGCFKTTSVTVNNTYPSAIGGILAVCAGGAATLSDATTGGTWSSANTSVATVAANTGAMNGVTAGTVNISYTQLGCSATQVVTVAANPLPANTGPGAVCVGNSITLANAVTGGTWSINNASFATVGDATGVVNGIAVGVPVISYTLSNGCFKTSSINVSNNAPAAITGAASVCAGGSLTTLTDATTGGSWSSGNNTVATILSSGAGVVYGVAAGTVSITYTKSGCYVTQLVTVNTNPLGPNTGTSTICIGGSTVISNATPGGNWSSNTTSVGTIDTTTGLATGVAAGATVITYKLGSGCFKTSSVTVKTPPAAITGISTVCTSTPVTLADGVTGGTWTSSNSAKATVVATTGKVTGVAAGTANISYTISGCAPVTFPISISVCRFGENGTENLGVEGLNIYNVYPNPSDGNLTLTQSVVVDETVSVTIMNTLGQVVYTNMLDFANGIGNLNLTGDLSGIHILMLTDSRGKVQTFRLAIVK